MDVFSPRVSGDRLDCVGVEEGAGVSGIGWSREGLEELLISVLVPLL